MSLNSFFNSIIHRQKVRVANLEQIAKGLNEHNKRRIASNITANNTAVKLFVAPWSGVFDSLVVSSPTATVSSSSNHVTITVINVTTSVTLFTFDTYTNTTELLANQGVLLSAGSVAISPINGLPVSNFKQYDLISVTIQVTGTPGPTSSSVMTTLFTAFPTDANYAV